MILVNICLANDLNNFWQNDKIFLIDGDPSGRLTCELSNWKGLAYRIHPANTEYKISLGEWIWIGKNYLVVKV